MMWVGEEKIKPKLQMIRWYRSHLYSPLSWPRPLQVTLLWFSSINKLSFINHQCSFNKQYIYCGNTGNVTNTHIGVNPAQTNHKSKSSKPVWVFPVGCSCTEWSLSIFCSSPFLQTSQILSGWTSVCCAWCTSPLRGETRANTVSFLYLCMTSR